MPFTDSYQDTMCPLAILIAAACEFTDFHYYGRFRNMHSSEAGGASLNLSILKSPLILFNSIKNWTTAG